MADYVHFKNIFISGIALVRYILVCSAYREYMTCRVCDAIAVSCILHGALWAALPFVPDVSEYVLGRSGIACGPDWNVKYVAYNVGIFIFGFFFPIIISTISYCKIFKKVGLN